MINMNPVLFLENKPINNIIISGSFNSISSHDDIIQEMELAQYNCNNAIKQLEIVISEQDSIMNNNRLYYRPLTEGLAGDAIDVVTSAIDSIIEFITSMFSKFFMSINKIIGRDTKWYQDNRGKILSPSFKLPDASGKFSEWKDYKLDRLKKSLVDKSFSINDQNMLKMLEDDAKAFEDDIFRRIGGSRSEIDSSITDFKSQCEYLYSGPDKEVDVSTVQNDIKTYFEYCADFLSGKNSSVYEAISNDSKKLDESKRNVEQEVAKLAAKIRKTPVNNNTSQQSQNNTGGEENQTTSNAAEKAAEAQINSFDMASFFNLKSIYEAGENDKDNGGGSKMQTPEVSKDDAGDKGADTNKEEPDESVKLQDIKDKAVKYFKLTANAIGGQMSAAVKAYNQYNKLFRWAIKNQKSGNNNNQENKQKENQQKQTNDKKESDKESKIKDKKSAERKFSPKMQAYKDKTLKKIQSMKNGG